MNQEIERGGILKREMQPLETDKKEKPPFISPLQEYVAVQCSQCDWLKGKCRLEDKSGVDRMALCIHLWINKNTEKSVDDFARGLIATAEASDKSFEKENIE